jgi:hypothetical protein
VVGVSRVYCWVSGDGGFLSLRWGSSLLCWGSASAAEPPGCSSPSLSLLHAMAAALLLLLAPERLRFGTSRPDELAPPARARFFFFFWFFFLGGL